MTDLRPSPRSGARIAKSAAALLALALASGALWYWRVHSFHMTAVVPGEIFRAPQPTADEVASAAAERGIRTIVNLRGPNPKHDWYVAERDAAARMKLGLVSLRFETFDWPPRIETLALVAALDRSPRPILMHCHSGLDRSGWAAGLVRLLRGESLDAARSELSRLKGHLCDRDSCALHRFFDLYESWLAASSKQSSPEAFREWLQSAYYPPPYAARISPQDALPSRAASGARVAFPVRVENISGEPWQAPNEKERGVRLGARILGPFASPPEDSVEIFRVPRTTARDLFRDGQSTGSWAAGAAKTIDVAFDAPSEPGLYFVQVDMVDEFVHWFSDLGDAGLVFPLRVEPAGTELRIGN